MTKYKTVIILASVALILALVVLFRVVLPFGNVFDPAGVQLNTVDAYYMVRYADLYSNGSPDTDYYMSYPDGLDNTNVFYSKIIALLAALFYTSNITMAAVLPVIWFIGIMAAVYCVASRLLDSKTALLSIGLLAVMPGEFMYRTILGAGDRHALEIFTLTSIMLSLMYSLVFLRDRKYTFSLAWLTYAAILQAIYMLLWPGGSMYTFLILAAFCITWLIVNYWRRWQIWAITGIATLTAIITVGQYLPQFNNYIGGVGLYAGAVEGQSLIFTAGHFDMSYISMWYGVALFLALFGIGLLIYQYKQTRRPELLLFIVWTLVNTALTFYIRRWGYYLAVNVSIITAYVINYILRIKMNKAAIVRVAVAVILVVLVPLTYNSVSTAASDSGYMPSEWRECCSYLKNNLALDSRYSTCRTYDHAVLANWSYGYWIVHDGNMPAYATPGNHRDDKLTAPEIELLRIGYVITDNTTLNYSYPVIWQSTNSKLQILKVL